MMSCLRTVPWWPLLDRTSLRNHLQGSEARHSRLMNVDFQVPVLSNAL